MTTDKKVTGTELANTLEQRMMDAATADLIAQMDSVHDALVVNTSSIDAVLPESIFVNYFLPYFSGEMPITLADKVLTEWVSIAGTPTNEISIIDTTNKVLFKIPSLFDTSIIDVLKRGVGESMGDIFTGYELRKNNIPSVANRFLNDSLADKAPSIIKQSTQLTNGEKRWSEIFERYGKGKGVASTTTPEAAGVDDVEYE